MLYVMNPGYEHATDESQNSTPETNNAPHVN